MPVPPARSKAWVCGRSPVETVGSNPTGGMDVCFVCVVCCQVEVSATSSSLVQRSSTDCDASLCVNAETVPANAEMVPQFPSCYYMLLM